MSNTFKSLVLGNITGIAAVISALVYFPVLMNVAFDTFPKNDAWTVIAIFGGYFLLWLVVHMIASQVRDVLTGILAWVVTTALMISSVGLVCIPALETVFEGNVDIPWHFWLFASSLLVAFNTIAAFAGVYAYNNFYEVTDKAFFRRSNTKIMQEEWRYAVNTFCSTYGALILVTNTVIISCTYLSQLVVNCTIQIS